jgi:hypothetical protein
LCLFFNKISDKSRTGPAGTERGRRKRVEEGGRVEK